MQFIVNHIQEFKNEVESIERKNNTNNLELMANHISSIITSILLLEPNYLVYNEGLFEITKFVFANKRLQYKKEVCSL
jgi:hypothetical protein